MPTRKSLYNINFLKVPNVAIGIPARTDPKTGI